jgi:para-aminobenzoate synthetase component 1
VGRLSPGKGRIDLLKATFPGGSITGAPKVRAMEIIDELEPTRRSVYTGAIGYLSFDGNMDLNIVIRTIIIKKGRAYFQVGGGIVYDSEPGAEYQETLDKGKALIQALRLSPQMAVESAP